MYFWIREFHKDFVQGVKGFNNLFSESAMNNGDALSKILSLEKKLVEGSRDVSGKFFESEKALEHAMSDVRNNFFRLKEDVNVIKKRFVSKGKKK
jgi:hypothetical protein